MLVLLVLPVPIPPLFKLVVVVAVCFEVGETVVVVAP